MVTRLAWREISLRIATSLFRTSIVDWPAFDAVTRTSAPVGLSTYRLTFPFICGNPAAAPCAHIVCTTSMTTLMTETTFTRISDSRPARWPDSAASRCDFQFGYPAVGDPTLPF